MQDYTGINVTSLIKDMLNNRNTSYGIMLKLKTEEYYRRVLFATSDAPEKNKRPKLVIYYKPAINTQYKDINYYLQNFFVFIPKEI